MRRPWLLAIATSLLPAVVWAQAPSNTSPGLDRLLKLPRSMEYSAEEKGGATRSEWRQRFGDARKALENAERALEQSQAKLATSAGSKSEWQLAPPGIPSQQPSEDSSSSYALREEVRRQRGEVERAKARLRELDVQANLAGVPEDWRAESTEAGSGDGPGDVSETGPASPR